MKRSPLLFIGPPGCGKTARAYALAKELNLDVVYLPLSERDPCEIAGAALPDRETGIVRWLPSADFARAAREPMVIILDELTAATRAQRVAALRWADPSTPLHPETRVIATCNPPEYAAGAGDPLCAPELSRFRIRSVGAEDAIRWLCGQSGQVGLVGRYLRSNPKAAIASPEAMQQAVDAQEPFPTPRGWHRAAMEGEDSAFAELVGAPAAASYLHWREQQDLPSPEAILAGEIEPKNAVPKRADGALATATALSQILLNASGPMAERIDRAAQWFAAAAQEGHAGIVSLELGRILLLPSAAVLRPLVNKGKLLEDFAKLVKK